MYLFWDPQNDRKTALQREVSSEMCSFGEVHYPRLPGPIIEWVKKILPNNSALNPYGLKSQVSDPPAGTILDFGNVLSKNQVSDANTL